MSFDKLAAEKHEALDVLRSRNKRLAEVYAALGESVTHLTTAASASPNLATTTSPTGRAGTGKAAIIITDAQLADEEVPESLFSASEVDLEAVCPGYTALRAQQTAGVPSAKSATTGVADDVTHRALMEIMDGKEKGRNRLDVLAAALAKAPWMDAIAEEHMSAEQRGALAAYGVRLAAFNEEKAKQRNLLMTEM